MLSHAIEHTKIHLTEAIQLYEVWTVRTDLAVRVCMLVVTCSECVRKKRVRSDACAVS